jgi:hypothetical protein
MVVDGYEPGPPAAGAFFKAVVVTVNYFLGELQ